MGVGKPRQLKRIDGTEMGRAGDMQLKTGIGPSRHRRFSESPPQCTTRHGRAPPGGSKVVVIETSREIALAVNGHHPTRQMYRRRATTNPLI